MLGDLLGIGLVGAATTMSKTQQGFNMQVAAQRQQAYEEAYNHSRGIHEHNEEEYDLRKNNASVKDAWEQYQVMLKLNRKG